MARSIRQLEALRDEWNALAAPLRTPLMEHDWFLSCAEAFCAEPNLRVLTVRERQTLTGVAPLARESASSGARLMLLGSAKLYEPSGWLFAGDAAVADLADQAVRTGLPLVMQRVPVDSPLVLAMTAIPSHRAVTSVRGTTTSLAVSVRGSWDAYYAGLSSHITGNLRRLRKKAERDLGRMQVTHAEPAAAEVDRHLDDLVRVEGSGWKGRAGSSLQQRPDLLDFFRRYCRRAADARRLRVTTVAFGAQLAAVELSVEAHGRMWQLKIGFHDALAAYYPGLHLTEASIRNAFARGLEAYEFLGSAAPWEERWASDTRTYATVATYPLSATAVFTVCRDLAGYAWRRAHALVREQGAVARP
jgi:CelD/BcsL family acetyltransferase involved in cellulose biosynthesis